MDLCLYVCTYILYQYDDGCGMGRKGKERKGKKGGRDLNFFFFFFFSLLLFLL